MARMTVTTCPTCRIPRRIRVADLKRVKQCRKCHLSQIAPLGYAATKAKYGADFAVRFVREWRTANPSNLEQIVIDWLDIQGIYYEREYWMQTASAGQFLVDFMLAGAVAIEVNGTWAHSFHVDRDTRKVQALKAEGFTVIELSEADVKSSAFVHRLAAHLFPTTQDFLPAVPAAFYQAAAVHQTPATRSF